jgi:hypothetical protein
MSHSNATDAHGLEIIWSPHYHPQWDDKPEEYVRQGIVAWGRSRRLARVTDTQRGFKGYLGVQHNDPSRWHIEGVPTTRFFLSLFLHGRTVTLRTYATCQEEVAALHVFHASLVAQDAK